MAADPAVEDVDVVGHGGSSLVLARPRRGRRSSVSRGRAWVLGDGEVWPRRRSSRQRRCRSNRRSSPSTPRSRTRAGAVRTPCARTGRAQVVVDEAARRRAADVRRVEGRRDKPGARVGGHAPADGSPAPGIHDRGEGVHETAVGLTGTRAARLARAVGERAAIDWGP